MPPTTESRVFTATDQQAFADLSGDYNPMHMDEAAARRTQAGACVVHGVNLFLWGLELLARNGLPVASAVTAKVKFAGFVYLNQLISLEILKSDDTGLRFQLVANGNAVLSAVLGFGVDKPQQQPGFPASPPIVEIGSAPADLALEEMADRAGRVKLTDDARALARRLYPKLCERLDDRAVGETALMSALVGMIVPGLHSIFSELALTYQASDGIAPGIVFKTKQVDPRFRKVELHAKGSRIEANAMAFARLPPQLPPSVESVATAVNSGEFRGRRALIIGGSRGIGAVTAKAIAAGGGTVAMSYANSLDDAEAVRDDIASFCGAGIATLMSYRVGADALSQLAAVNGPFSHAYYFPTPRIFRQDRAMYSASKLAEFLKVYVDGFNDFASALLATHSPKALALFYPSSIAVTNRPKGMTEYAMAKAAGEILCVDLMRSFPGLTISMPRLPRIQTDQTATVPPVPAASALDVMLPLLRAERNPQLYGSSSQRL